MICSKCGVDHVKTKTEKRVGASRFGKYRHEDEKGRAWSGRTCPDCCSARSKFQFNRQAPVVMTARLCRRCGKKLPESRYFYHESCFPNTEYYDIFEAYESRASDSKGVTSVR